MSKNNNPKTAEKTKLHTRNRHRQNYDFATLIKKLPELSQHVILNKYGNETVDFFNPNAVKALNKALLLEYYNLSFWDIPANYLCPPIPGRADYIHYAADILSESYNELIPKGNKIKCLDIGVGANCVYPIVGNNEYGWSFTGSDIDKTALESANKIIELNPHLSGEIELRIQNNSTDVFFGIIKKGERYDLTICNPPFHSSAREAQSGTLRKLSNLKHKKVTKANLSFGGQSNELWCKGGEEKFVQNMIRESRKFSESCLWFTTLISKHSNLKGVHEALEKAKALTIKTIPMGQGNKISRIVAWTFLSEDQHKKWTELNWK